MYIKLSPSILSADFSRLGEQIIEAEKAGADYIHIDVMDGKFVPEITIGALVVKALRRTTDLTFDVHLMVDEPLNQITSFAEAGEDIITVHAEACTHLHRTIQRIKELKVKAGVSLNPATPLTMLDEILPSLDLVLLMSVNPGFAGQPFIEDVLGKITRLRGILDSNKLAAEIEVDGGINATIAPKVVKAGATVLVAGSAIFHQGESVKDAIQRIRKSLKDLDEG